MAILFSDIQFLGSVGNLSAYRMKGSDKIILRKKGGGSRKKIKTSPSCERIRKINMEFGGRSAVTKLIRRALGPVRLLADFNFTGHLHKILQPIQADDPINKTGERSVPLTRNPKLLEGFSLNRNRTFESVIRTPVSYSLDKDNRSATLTIPALMPGVNFFPHPYHAIYSFVLTLGIVPDLHYNAKSKTYKSQKQYATFQPPTVFSDWRHVSANADELTLQVSMSKIPPDSHHTLILSAGIRYGTIDNNMTNDQAKGAGSAKILAVV